MQDNARKITCIPFFHLRKHSLDPKKCALKYHDNSRKWVYISILLRFVVSGARGNINEKDIYCKLCSLEVDTETKFRVQDVYCERKWEERTGQEKGLTDSD